MPAMAFKFKFKRQPEIARPYDKDEYAMGLAKKRPLLESGMGMAKKRLAGHG